jgi:hypothetical protein
MEEGHSLTDEEEFKEGEEEYMKEIPYAQLVGSLNYLSSCTRPDITFPVNLLCRFMGTGKARRKHWDAAKRVCQYLKGTLTHGVTLGGTTPLRLQAYVDASWADDNRDRRSTLGFCTTLGSGLISWKSGRSGAVALSTAESEYYSAGEGAREVVHLRQLLDSIGYPQEQPTGFGSDSQAALAIIKNSSFSPRTKHIDIRAHWLRELVQNRIIDPTYIPTEENPADIFTKALGFIKLAHLLSLVQVQATPR